MKKLLVLVLIISCSSAGHSQSILNRFKDKVKNRAEQRVDEGMDKAIDETENKVKEEKKKSTAKVEEKKEAEPRKNEEVKSPASPSLKVYSKYDFIPGEHIVYAEDFSQDAVGELPLKWASNNRGEAVSLQNMPNQWMRMFPASNLASSAIKKLPENFTMELDLLLQFNGEAGYRYPEIEIKLLELLSSDANARNYIVNMDAAKEVALVLMPAGAGEPLSVTLKTYEKGLGYFSNEQKELKTLSDNKGIPIHIAIWVQKERIRYWINADKVFDIPQAVPVNAAFNRIGFRIESSLYTEEQLGMFVSGIKIAEGTPDMRSKLMTEGKLVTNGILFDLNSDKIKPESAGVLKEIAVVLKENTGVKVKIVGHTDSDGEDKKNMDLSKRRAAAVKNALSTEFGIDASRLETDGLGETKPVADNKTKEGKAQNRRIEFIKL